MARNQKQTVSGIEFEGYGAHYDGYPHNYMTAAVALGMKREDIDRFVNKLKVIYMKNKII